MVNDIGGLTVKPVRAFVGHSFTPDDAVVVDLFLKYLTAVADMHPLFSWQHAERAEPRVIDEKVLELFAGKTLFIAICTRKERVVSAKDLGRLLLRRNKLAADENAFEWKTSDWIIQEIGLAIGLGLPAILLVEDGVRSPGGLQGNLEYIAFTRTAPEKSFPKLLQMIGSLSPRATDAQAVSDASTSSPADETQKQEPQRQDEAWTTPSPTWSIRRYEFAFLHFAAMKDEAGASRVSDAFLASSLGREEEARKTWEAYCERRRIEFDAGGKIQRLLTLVADSPGSPGTLENLAHGYLHYDEYLKAADAFERAASSAKGAHANRLLREAAVAAQKASEGSRALRLVDRMRHAVRDGHADSVEILEAEFELAELRKESDIQIAALEGQLEFSPEDTHKRFALAYRYADRENDDLAVLHYARIGASHRSGATWNNLAVSLDRLAIAGKSVAAYRRAEAHGETLAMSNLALKLMGAGFFDEAKNICETAIAIKDHHKNVDTSLSRIKVLPDEEDKKETLALDRARPISAFYREFGSALTRLMPTTLAKVWRGPDCGLEITLEEEKLRATGTYERGRLGLMAVAMMRSEGATQNDDGGKDRFRVEYVADARGSALVGRVQRLREGAVLKKAAATLLTPDEDPTVLLVVSADAQSIRVMERGKSGSPRFYDFVATQ